MYRYKVGIVVYKSYVFANNYSGDTGTAALLAVWHARLRLSRVSNVLFETRLQILSRQPDVSTMP